MLAGDAHGNPQLGWGLWVMDAHDLSQLKGFMVLTVTTSREPASSHPGG